MNAAFYKQRPERDAAYRQLVLTANPDWEVRLLGGIKWGEENATVVKRVRAGDFDHGKSIFDQMFRELCDEGWRPYTPYEIWD